MLTPPRPSRRVAALTALGVAAVAPAFAIPAVAQASHKQITIIQDGNLLQADPTGTLAQMRALGATTVRVPLYWSSVAPKISSTKKPHFNASSPGAYSSANWAPYDAIVEAAKTDGMTIDLTVEGGAPRWAEGAGIPSNYIYPHNGAAKYFAWKPNAGDYGQFMKAVATRYSGHYKPRGASSALPRVHFWTIWNEPNFGEDLGPQATDTSRISYAPMLYRNLVRSGYAALKGSGHGSDTILIGEFAAHGFALSNGHHGPTFPQGLPGNAGQTQPLPFIRTLYCLDQHGNKLRGTAARQVGCASDNGFRQANPGLFKATGVGDHPYANNATPVSDGKSNPNWSTFPNFPLLEHTLDQANHVWGSGEHYPIYNDEYGYITDPPQNNPKHSVPTKTAAKYINWAEYLSWTEKRTASYDQYLIDDPAPSETTGNGGFATGLFTSSGKPKPSLDAFRLPLWIPSTSLAKPGRDRVWGEARPAYWTARDSHEKQTVQVQFRAQGAHSWTTVSTAHDNGYFVVRPKFSHSGSVRLRYTYPKRTDSLLPSPVSGMTIVSRTQAITVK